MKRPLECSRGQTHVWIVDLKKKKKIWRTGSGGMNESTDVLRCREFSQRHCLEVIRNDRLPHIVSVRRALRLILIRNDCLSYAWLHVTRYEFPTYIMTAWSYVVTVRRT